MTRSYVSSGEDNGEQRDESCGKLLTLRRKEVFASCLYVMFGAQHILTTMAKLVTVGDVCGSVLTNFDAETRIAEAENIWEGLCQDRVPSDPLEYISLVTRDGKTIGWLDFSDLVADPERRQDTVETCMMKISVDALVSSATPLLEAMKLFNAASPYFFLVIKGNEIIGAFSYQDLLSVPFRACLFSMLLSVEQAMLDIVHTAPTLAVSKLKAQRAKQIQKKLPRGKAGTASAEQILTQLFFSDVLNIVRSCNKTKGILSAVDQSFFKSRRIINLKAGKMTYQKEKRTRLDQILELRNALAHPSRPWRIAHLLQKDDLQAFFTWLNELEGQLINYLALGRKLED